MRKLNEDELYDLAEEIKESYNDGATTLCWRDKDGVEMEVSFEIDAQFHQENDYFNGTGSWVNDYVKCSITEVICDDEQLDIDINKLEGIVEDKIAA